MAYTKLEIANKALRNLGAAKINSLTEDSDRARDVNAVYDFMQDEVLESADWRFAKIRVALVKSGTTPANFYDFAYLIPDDFMRIFQEKELDPAVFESGNYVGLNGFICAVGYKFTYVVETLDDGTECLFTDYDSDNGDLFLTYIRRAVGGLSQDFVITNSGLGDLYLTDSPAVTITGDTEVFTLGADASSPIASGESSTFTIDFTPSVVGDYTATVSIANNDSDENPYTFALAGEGALPNYTAKFVDTLAWRIAAELAIKVTNSTTKEEQAMIRYEQALKGAVGLDQSLDFLESETGDNSWSGAGRW
jgi:hypothetical protein